MLHLNGHLGLHSLYNNFCVLSFHSVLCFSNDYHIVKEEKWNRYDLKNINYNKVNNIFFISVPKVCASLICSGFIHPGGICPGGICPGDICPGGICPGGICPRGCMSMG